MTLSSLSATQLTAPQEVFDSDKVRALIAGYLGIEAKQVTDETHFGEFGMDRYDRLEMPWLHHLSVEARQCTLPISITSSF
jgi:hypothetical protein